MKKRLSYTVIAFYIATGVNCLVHADSAPILRIAAIQEPATTDGTLPEIEVRPPTTPDTPVAPPATEPEIAPNSLVVPPTTITPEPTVAPVPDTSSSSGTNAVPPFSNPPSSNLGNNGFNPSQSISASDRIAFGQPFPSLSAQSFGGNSSDVNGLNSVVRGEGSVFSTPQLATVISRAELDRKQATTMYRALQNEVGVMLQQTGNGQLSPFIRGLTGQQILVLVDGIRMNTSILRPGPNQYTATIDPGMIDHIEIVRGAESAMWGSDAIGGVINVVTKSADPLRGDYFSPGFTQTWSSAEAASYTRTNFSTWYGQTGITGGVSYLDVGLVDRGGGLGRQPATDFEQFAADLKLQRMLSDDHMLTVAMQHLEQQNVGRSDRFLPFVLGPASNGSVPTQRPTYFDPQQRDLAYLRFEGLINDDIMFADAYSLTFSGMRTREASIVDRYSSNASTAQPTRREVGEFDDWGFGVQASVVKSMGDLGKLTYGADFYDEQIDSVRTRIDNPTSSSPSSRPDDPQYPDDSQASRVGTFLSWYVPLTERLETTTSVRYENIDLSGTPDFDNIGQQSYTRNYNDWIGSVGLGYKLTEEFKLIGGVYEGFRAPTIDDLTANKTSLQNNQSVPLLGNLAVQPEHSLTYEAGMKFNTDKFRFQISEFWTDFDSFIDRAVINNTDFLTNQTAYINGTELAGDYSLTKQLSLYGNFFYTYGQQTSTGEPLSRIPPLQGTIGLRFTEPIYRSYFDVYTWMVDRADRYNSGNLGDVRFIAGGTPGYATLNMRTGRSFGVKNQNQVSLSLENITDKYYRVLGSGVDGTGFNAVLGYQYTH